MLFGEAEEGRENYAYEEISAQSAVTALICLFLLTPYLDKTHED